MIGFLSNSSNNALPLKDIIFLAVIILGASATLVIFFFKLYWETKLFKSNTTKYQDDNDDGDDDAMIQPTIPDPPITYKKQCYYLAKENAILFGNVLLDLSIVKGICSYSKSNHLSPVDSNSNPLNHFNFIEPASRYFIGYAALHSKLISNSFSHLSPMFKLEGTFISSSTTPDAFDNFEIKCTPVSEEDMRDITDIEEAE